MPSKPVTQEERPADESPGASSSSAVRVLPDAAPTATLLHDLNHFLSAALAHVEDAESAEDLPRSRESLSAIQDSLFGAAAIVRTLARTLSAAKPPETEPKERADVARCFRQVARILSLPGRASVEVQLPNRRVVLDLSEVELKQLLMNLATNAIEAGARSVVMSLEAGDDTFATLRVRDDGPGMAEAVRTRLFEPFFTTKRDHDGLGLSGVRAAVERHAGRIEVESHEGRGTTFSIRVPLRAAPTERVLIVDPDTLSARLAARMLSRAGYETAIATGRDDARIEIARTRVDVAVVDVGFGNDAAVALVGELEAAHVRVIATSSREIAWSQRGPLLRKPFAVDDLLDAVRAQLPRGEPAPEP